MSDRQGEGPNIRDDAAILSAPPEPPDGPDWQGFTHDAEDVNPPERCAFPSHGRGSHRGHPNCRDCDEVMGICLRRKGHPLDWHEGRSRSGNLVSWPATATDGANR